MDPGQSLQKGFLLGAIDFRWGYVFWKSSERENKSLCEKTRNGTTVNKSGFSGSLHQAFQTSKRAFKGSLLAFPLRIFYGQISAISGFGSPSPEPLGNAGPDHAHPCHTGSQTQPRGLQAREGNGQHWVKRDDGHELMGKVTPTKHNKSWPLITSQPINR